MTHVQPGLINTDMVAGMTADFSKMFNMRQELFTEKSAKMLLPEDIGTVVWEAVSRPGRCYQTEIMLKDVFFQDETVMAEMMGGAGGEGKE